MNLYVGSLGYDVEEAEIQRLFEQFGEVKSVRIIKDKETGQSKGFGFVEMENKEDAMKALERLNGHELNGRNIRVNLSKSKRRGYRKG
jgi:RNA recognition motif-containing protein